MLHISWHVGLIFPLDLPMGEQLIIPLTIVIMTGIKQRK